jgi:hypothetical protein
MTSSSTARRPGIIAGALLAAGLLAAAPSAGAQAPSNDTRWQGWIGCWQPLDAALAPDDGGAPVTCIVPATGASAVELATVVDGKVVSRDRIDASGTRRDVTRDGCTGWEQATWAADGRRVFLSSSLACPGGLDRTSSGVIAMSAEGEWLDVQGITAGGNSGVQVVRYGDVGLPEGLPTDIAAAVRQATSGRSLALAARTSAAAPIDTRDVAEAVKLVDAAVVQAWITERRQGFDLDAKELVALADAGIPERVIDVMVALSYPTRFALAPTNGQRTVRQPGQPHVIESPDDRDLRRPSLGMRAYGDPFYDSAFYSPYGYSRYGYRYGMSRYGYGYSPYGYSPYGYSPYNSGYGWYTGGGPVVIIRDPGSGNTGSGNTGASNGRVVNGRGYTRGDRTTESGTGRTAAPRSEPTTGSSRTNTRDTGSSSGSSSSGSGESTTPTRTAKPRNP